MASVVIAEPGLAAFFRAMHAGFVVGRSIITSYKSAVFVGGFFQTRNLARTTKCYALDRVGKGHPAF